MVVNTLLEEKQTQYVSVISRKVAWWEAIFHVLEETMNRCCIGTARGLVFSDWSEKWQF